MWKVRHRVNHIQELESLPVEFGVELDIRSANGRLVLQHEPGQAGDDFEEYVKIFARRKFAGPMIVNPKEDGWEGRILTLLEFHGVKNFFFLDCTIPTMVKWCARQKRREFAVRVSEYEPLESALRFAGLADWVWLDSFSGTPAEMDLARTLKKRFKICLVSPELEGYAAETIAQFKPLLPLLDAVCTKHPEQW